MQTEMAAAGRRCDYVLCDAATASLPSTDTLDALLVDDVERLPPDGQIALFNAYNAMRERGAALVAAGDAPAVQLPLRADVITRLGWGLVYQLHALTDEEKMQALCDYAQQLGFELDDGIADYLLRHVARDMSSLLAMLRALDRYSLEAKRPVTLALVRELVRAKISPTQ
jgi:DnaA family protein